MSKLNVEKAIDAEILTILANNNAVVEEMDPTLKEVLRSKAKNFLVYGAFLTSAIAVAGIPNNAHAMDNTLKGTLGAAAIAGVLASGNQVQGLPADCANKNMNGWKVGGAGAIGAAVGNQFGGGNGKKALTILGGLFGASAAANSENNRMMEECVNNAIYAPNRQMNNQMPQDNIYYQGVKVSTGEPYYITAKTSLGMAAMFGKLEGKYDMHQVNPVIKNALDETATNFENSFRNLDIASQELNKRLIGTVETRYRVGNTEEAMFQETQNQLRIEYLKQELDRAFVSYSESRAMFVHMTDNAAADGVRITQYQPYVNYIEPPASTQVIFNGNAPNKFAILPNARMR